MIKNLREALAKNLTYIDTGDTRVTSRGRMVITQRGQLVAVRSCVNVRFELEIRSYSITITWNCKIVTIMKMVIVTLGMARITRG